MGIEDKNFELLLSQKKHNELIVKLDAILKELINNKGEAMDTQKIEDAIKKMTVKSEIEEIPKSILALSEVIVSKIQELNTKESEWTFNIERDSDGFIEVVKAKSK